MSTGGNIERSFEYQPVMVGSLIIREKDADDLAGTGVAHLWTPSADGLLHYVDENGNDTVIATSSTAGSWQPVRLATVAAIAAFTYDATAKTITFNAVGSQSVDGIATVAGDRIGVKDETGATEKRNGIYSVTTKGTGAVAEVWTRTDDADESADFIDGKVFAVAEGTLAGTVWYFTTDAPFTLDTTAVTFARETNVMLLNIAQTVTVAKTFKQDTLKQNNSADTFATTLRSAATSNRTNTFPDNAGTLVAIASQAIGDLAYADSASTWARLADVAAGSYLRSGGVATAPVWSTLTLPDAATQGDIFAASGANAMGVIAAVAAGKLLRAAGAGALPAYSTFTIPDTFAAGSLVHASGADTLAALAADATAGKFLRNVAAATAPAWSTLVLPNAAAQGEVPFASAADTITMLAVGSAGQILRSGGAGANVVWSTATFPNTATQGDLIAATGANAFGVIAAAAAGKILRAAGAGALPAYSAATFPDAATRGAVLVASAADTWAALAVGGAGTILRSDGTDLIYSTATFPNTVTGAGRYLRASGANAWAESTSTIPDTFTQGDLVVATAANVLGVVADVAVGQVLASGGVGAVPAYTDSPSLTGLTLATHATFSDGAVMKIQGRGTGTGDIVARYGSTDTEGLEIRVYEDTVSPNAVETNLLNVPANSVIYSVQGNCESALTGGGTTVTWSIGTAATPDKYGTAGNGAGDTLAQNGKLDFTATPTRLASAEQIVLTGCAAGGAADGTAALTVGSVRVRIVYATCNSLDDA